MPQSKTEHGLAFTQEGTTLIAIERARQKTEKGWTLEHDDQHTVRELIAAARCYLLAAACSASDHSLPDLPVNWPWKMGDWKPSEDPIRNLAKAGALIAAEIDRQHRLTKPQ